MLHLFSRRKQRFMLLTLAFILAISSACSSSSGSSPTSSSALTSSVNPSSGDFDGSTESIPSDSSSGDGDNTSADASLDGVSDNFSDGVKHNSEVSSGGFNENAGNASPDDPTGSTGDTSSDTPNSDVGDTSPGDSTGNSGSGTIIDQINGYYWYLDGYKYAYLRPSVVDWYDHQILQWQSENIDISNNSLVALETLSPDAYYAVVYQAESNCHNALMVNPLEYYDMLVQEYNMRVSGSKLYMTIGGTQYSFTRSSNRKAIPVTLSLSKNTVSVPEYTEFSIVVTATPFFAAESFTVRSSNTSVVQAYDNVSCYHGSAELCFEAFKAGSSTITITDTASGSSKTLVVTVEAPPPAPVTKVSSVSLSQSSVSLYRGSSVTLSAAITPTDATDQSVTWSSSDTSVATVSKTGQVSAVGCGTAVITVTTNDGNHTASCTVTVTNAPLTATCSIGYFIQISNSMVQGIQAVVTPSGGSGIYSYYNIELYCGDSLVAKTTNTSSNRVYTTTIADGQYTAVYTVRDSEGNEYSGSATIQYSSSSGN